MRLEEALIKLRADPERIFRMGGLHMMMGEGEIIFTYHPGMPRSRDYAVLDVNVGFFNINHWEEAVEQYESPRLLNSFEGGVSNPDYDFDDYE